MIDAAEVMPEGARVDPWLERERGFLMRAPLGQRTRIRDMLHMFAATHKPPLRISIATDWDDPDYFRISQLA